MEYSFENFTILDKKKNGKADKIHFTVLEGILLRCDCIGVDLFNGLANTKPYTQICKDLYDASLICKKRLLQNGEVFHHAIVHDVLDDLIHEVNLSAVKFGSICPAQRRGSVPAGLVPCDVPQTQLDGQPV